MIYQALCWMPLGLLAVFLINLFYAWFNKLKANLFFLIIFAAGVLLFLVDLAFALSGGWNLESSLPATLFGEPWDSLVGRPFYSFFDETASMPGEEASEDFLGSRWACLIVLSGLVNLSVSFVACYRYRPKRRSISSVSKVEHRNVPVSGNLNGDA